VEGRLETGAARAGSQLQTQRYVNERTEELNAAIRAEFADLDGATIEWRSPLARDAYAEYWDKAFLEKVDLDQHADSLKSFWPTGGPHWDALAVVTTPRNSRPGVLLAEGKSYPGELHGSGCQAKPRSPSRALIEKSLGQTRERLGVPARSASDWSGPLYQSANRLAHLCWLRSLGVRAWLVHLPFVDDPHKPTSVAEWTAALGTANRELGLDGLTVDGTAHVLLRVGSTPGLRSDSKS